MFDAKQCEKMVVFYMLKREIARRRLSEDGAAMKLGITRSMYDSMMHDSAKYYSLDTVMQWTESAASDLSLEQILDSKLNRKSCPRPKDPFYQAIWEFIANIECEKNNKI